MSTRWWEQLPRRGAEPTPEPPRAAASVIPVPKLGRVAPPAAFLSHSSIDAPVAREVCDELESHGLACWMAPRNIAPGTEWAVALVDGIQRSRVMVVLLSSWSVASDEVRREVERAYAERKPVIPVRIDGSSLEGALAYYLSEVHWVDLTRRPVRRHLVPLVDRVQGLAGETLSLPEKKTVPHVAEVRIDRI